MNKEPKSGDTILEGYVYAQKLLDPNHTGQEPVWHYYYPNSSSLYSTEKKALAAHMYYWATYKPLVGFDDVVEVYSKKDNVYMSTIQRKVLKVKLVVE